MSKPIILIPSYNPDGTLPETIGLLREKGFERFVIVNDGSQAGCAPIFEQVADLPGVHLLTHAVNMGCLLYTSDVQAAEGIAHPELQRFHLPVYHSGQ